MGQEGLWARGLYGLGGLWAGGAYGPGGPMGQWGLWARGAYGPGEPMGQRVPEGATDVRTTYLRTDVLSYPSWCRGQRPLLGPLPKIYISKFEADSHFRGPQGPLT